MTDQLPTYHPQALPPDAPPPAPLEVVEPETSLQQILVISLAYWKASVIIAVVLTALVAAVLLRKPKEYIASATLLISPAVNDPISGKDFPAQMLENYMATQLELISSTVVLRPVVEKLKLHENPQLVGSLSLPEDVRRSVAEQSLSSRLWVNRKTFGSQLVSIYFRDTSPVGAADTLNAIAEYYVSRDYERANPDVDRAFAEYRSQVETLKAAADAAQEKLAGFMKRTGLTSIDARTDSTATNLARLQAELLDAEARRRRLEAEASSRRAASELAGTSPTAALSAKLAEQQTLMAQYRLTDGPKNPRVVELAAQIAATEAALNRSRSNVATSGDAEVAAARQLEARLQREIDAQRRKVIEQGEVLDEGAKLKLAADTAQANYRRAFERFDEISRNSASSYNNLKIVGRATPPTRSSSRRTRNTLLMAGVVGGGAGVVLPLLWGLVFRRVRCRDDLENAFGIPVLVEFPAASR